MKKTLLVFVLFGLALVLMVACTGVTPTPTLVPKADEETQEEPVEETIPPSPTSTQTEAVEIEPPATEPPTEEPTEVETEPTEALNEVEALILERCSDCHDTDRVFRAEKTEAEWEANIDRMVGYGADVSVEEKALMIEWLVSRDQ